MRAAAKVNPRTMPRNLARSPTSIFKAIQYMSGSSGPRERVVSAGRGFSRLVERWPYSECGQAERRDVVGQILVVERAVPVRTDQPHGHSPRHLVMQTLPDHAERQGIEPPVIGG